MSSSLIQIPPSQTPFTQFEKDVCISVKSIRAVLQSKRFRLKTKVSISAGDASDHKSFFTQSDNQLDWSLKSPMVIPHGKDLQISLKSSEKSTKMTLSYDNIIKHILGVDDEYNFKDDQGEVTVIFESNDIVELSRKRRSLISRLGVSIQILENILKFSDAIGEIHPAVKISLSCINRLLTLLKQQDTDNNDVLDLATDISDIVDFTFVVTKVETISQLNSTIGELRALFIQINELVTKRANRGNLKEIRSVLISGDQEEIEKINADLKRFKQNFDRGLLVQSTMDIKALFQRFDLTREDEEFLRRLERSSKSKSIAKRCLEGTREDILRTLLDWVYDLLALNVMWIRGYPGAGKSTIASHFADQLFQLHRLCIIFAFNRNDSTNPIDLWCTVAYELACRYHTCRGVIISKLKNDGFNITNATARDVFQELVVPSLRRLAESLKDFPVDCLPVFVIDALDECGGLSSTSGSLAARKEVISHILLWAELVPGFKLVVTSRPESDIEQLFSNAPLRSTEIYTGNVHGQQSIQDVSKYVKHRFDNMTVELCPPGWPGEDTIEELARRSGGIFIWAVTVLDFIEEFDPVNRLHRVRCGEATLGGVDTLYRQILEMSFSDKSAESTFTTLMSVVIVSQSVLSPSDYASLLDMDVHTVYSICGKLRSVLDSGSVLQVKHASFMDFLVTGEGQSDDRFHVNPDDGHKLLAESAFRVMNEELRFNICNMPSSFISNDELGVAHFQNAIRPVLAYACQFWGYHIERTRTRIDVTMVVRFMCLCFLSWLETMSGLGRSYFAFHSLKVLSKWVDETEGDGIPNIDEDTKELITDGIKFSQYFAPAMARSAAHVYVSAIPFAPKNSKVSQLYSPKLQRTVTLRLGQLTNWPSDSEWNVFRGHDVVVYSVAFSPDGNHVVSASGDCTIRIWEIQTRRTAAGPFKGHTQLIWSVGYSPDGQRIVSGSRDKTIRIWDVQTGETVLGPLMGHDDLVSSVTFTLDGKYIISASFDKTIRIWNATTSAAIMGPLRGHNGPVMSIALSPDGMHFASGSEDGTVLIWEIKSGNTVGEPFKGHEGQVGSVCYSLDGERVVSGSSNGTIRVWDVRTGQTVAGLFTGHQGPIRSIAFSPNGKYIVSGSFDKTIRVWETENGRTIAGSFSTHTDRVESVAFSCDSKHILSGSQDGTIRIWELDGGRMSENGIRVWDLKDETDANQFDGHANTIYSIAFSPDGAKIVSGSLDTSIRVWNVGGGKMTVQPFKLDNWPVYCVAYSPDGKRVASGSQDSAIWIFDVETGEVVVGPMEGHDNWILSVDVSPDGELIASGSADKTIRIWSARTGQLEAGPFIGHEDVVRSVAFSPTGKFVVSGSFDETVRVWSVETGETVLGPLRGHSNRVISVAYSPCGKYIASASSDHTIIIWNSETRGIARGPLIGHTHVVASVCYSPNGKFIASGSYDRTVRVWDVETGETVFGPFNGHSGFINCVTFSPDGNRVASCSDDKTIRIWELFTLGEQPTAGEETSIVCAKRSLVKDEGNNLFTDGCKKDKDGWVTGEEGGLLFWIPPHNTSLRWSSNSRVIGVGETEIDCTDVCWGNKWAECRKPL